jgi:hypothetical protein
MKQGIKVFVLAFLVNAFFMILPQQLLAQQENEYYKIFYDQLNSFGRWVDDPTYGSIWFPNVDEDFIPYVTNGYWVYSEFGLTWVSDFEWGWAPFHFGRWDYDKVSGWFWVPGYEWASAWVLWRRADGYYGWTQMRPNSSVDRYYDLPHEHWIFVKDNDVDRHDLAKIFVSRNNNTLIFSNSMIIDRVYHDKKRQEYYFSGPSREEIRRTIGRDMKTVKLVEKDTPGHSLNSDRLQVYKPVMHHVDNDPVPASGAIEPPARVTEKEKEKQQTIPHRSDGKAIRDLSNALNKILKGSSDRNRNDAKQNNQPNSNSSGNRGNQPSSGNNKNGVSSAPQGRPNQPNINNNSGSKPSSGSNSGAGSKPSSGNNSGGVNSGTQKPAQQNNNGVVGGKPASGGQNSGQQNGSRPAGAKKDDQSKDATSK